MSNERSQKSFFPLLKRILAFGGSLEIAVLLMTILAFVCGWATFVELDFGTPVAACLIYRSGWFHFLAFLLGLNVLFSLLTRLPWRKKHIPFLTAHFGIILLLLGCWATHRYAEEGRMILAEGRSGDQIILTNDWEFKIQEISPAASNHSENSSESDGKREITIPFVGGPLNKADWTPEGWENDILKPSITLRPESDSFLAKLGIFLARTHYRTVGKLAQLSRGSFPSLEKISDLGDAELRVTDYLVPGIDRTVSPFVIDLEKKAEDGTLQKESATLDFSELDRPRPNRVVSRRGLRQILPSGERILFYLADSQREAEILTQTIPSASVSETVPFTLLLYVQGETIAISGAEILEKGRQGDPKVQMRLLNARKGILKERLNQESKVDGGNDQAPAQTVTSEKIADIHRQIAEMKKTDPQSPEEETELAFQITALQDKAYLFMEIASLEKEKKTQKEFCAELKREIAKCDRDLLETLQIETQIPLGKSDWKIDRAEIVPTILTQEGPLEGWTVRVNLINEKTGEKDNLQLSSDWPERDLQGSVSGICGTLWGYVPDQMKTKIMGKDWNPQIKNPRLEIIQTPGGSLYYRAWNGKNGFSSGKLQETDQAAEGGKSFQTVQNAAKDSAETGIQSWTLRNYRRQDELGLFWGPAPFQKEMANDSYAKIRLNLKSKTGDWEESFWLRPIPAGLPDKEKGFFTHSLKTPDGTEYRISLENRVMAPGFSLYVKNFTPVYEPGSSTPSSFSSLLDYIPQPQEGEKSKSVPKRENVTVRMNQPGVFYSPVKKSNYWVYQDSFRGPFHPGDPLFDEITDAKILPGEEKAREKVYQTILTFNDDPGRGFKYFGSFLIILGTLLLIRKKKKEKKMNGSSQRNQSVSLGCGILAFFLFFGLTANAEENSPSSINGENAAIKSEVKDAGLHKESADVSGGLPRLDWTDWELIPVFSDGRIMPLSTFASIAVREICGSVHPVLHIDESRLAELEGDKAIGIPSLESILAVQKWSDEEIERLKAGHQRMIENGLARQKRIARRIREIFPKGKRSFTPAELLFSWIIEPEVWEYIPFLYDPKGLVREKVFAADLSDSKEETLVSGKDSSAVPLAEWISPAQLKESDAYADRIQGIQERSVRTFNDRETAVLEGRIDRACAALEKNFSRFKAITFYPGGEASPMPKYYLDKILYPADNKGARENAVSVLEELDETLLRLTDRLQRGLEGEAKSPLQESDLFLTQRVAVGEGQETREVLELLRQAHFLGYVYRRYSLEENERLFGSLLEKTEDSYRRLAAHRDAVFASESFSADYRKGLLKAVYLLGEVVDSLEKANLALYETGTYSLVKNPDKKRIVPKKKGEQTVYEALPAVSLNLAETGCVAVLPNLYRTLGESEEASGGVWLPFASILFASETIQKSGLGGLFPEKTDSSKIAPKTSSAESDPLDFPDGFLETLRRRVDSVSRENKAAETFLRAAESYLTDSGQNPQVFAERMKEFCGALRELGEGENQFYRERAESETNRNRLEALHKTAYPQTGEQDAELIYFRLNPFYWLWVFSLAASVLIALSSLLAIIKRPLLEKVTFWGGLVSLILAGTITGVGGGFRAYITGWAPVTNMFETVVLLAFLVLIVTLCYVLAPLIGPPISAAWQESRFSWKTASGEKDAKKSGSFLTMGRFWTLLRLLLTVGVFWGTIHLCYRENAFDHGIWQTFLDSFAIQGILDRAAILATIFLVVWFVPQSITAILILLVRGVQNAFRKETACPKEANEKTSAAEKDENLPPRDVWKEEILKRRFFLLIGALAAFGVGFLAYCNTTEFNPNIRPLTAVLRSNFWLTIHVLAIIFSYALGSLAWLLALTMLGNYLFGRYGTKTNQTDKAPEGVPTDVCAATSFDPPICLRLAPILLRLLQAVVLFLTLGTILGARWADFSWGRFWSWDAKEVWALVTLLIYLVVLHARKAGYGRVFGLAIGGVLGGLSIIMTWYGLSFVFGGGGRHSYAAGESNKTAILYLLIAFNILFTLLASLRYGLENRRRKKKPTPSKPAE